MRIRARKYRLGIVVVLAGVLSGLYLARAELLPPLARFLNVSEPPSPHFDYVMVLGGGSQTRPFVAAALVKTGKAAKVLVPTVKPPPELASEPALMEHEVIQRVLLARGVHPSAIVVLPGDCSSTSDEARALALFLELEPNAIVKVVTHMYHTRRARSIFTKTLGARSRQVGFIAAPVDGFHEDNWWQTEGGVVCYVNEFIKLGLHMLHR